ncbi:uncharacterized protein LOC131166039 [Malania oleifera]|uniref:uncharacterized protein LOC131166039 n=1 Tax=Malania oleifera TaxID=397392 RepID=UPI0025AD9F4C|nr:uncharacterized protein LOC131166039 [Malania oleifera]XP_057980248.1 uncharacterized protein LOC131166039 [Malania oleifera]
MFRLHKHKPDKSGERIDFSFSSFQALQVPKGWDKLFVSIISVKTGKTITKSGKASVRNGNCRWTDTLSESLWISRDNASTELEDCRLKFVVAMGSSRSGILGEATVNLAGYISSKVSNPESLHLKKCNHGTILQVKIQCLTPRAKLRHGHWKETVSYMENINATYDEIENESDVSDGAFSRSVRSSSSNILDGTSHQEELCSRGTSFSALGSRNSFDSMEGSAWRESSSPRSNISGVINNRIGRQDSVDSQNSVPSSTYSVDDPINNFSFKSKVFSGSQIPIPRDDSPHSIATSPIQSASSSKGLLETAEVTIVELRAEARMWEQNARKLMNDLEMLKKECSDQSKNQANLEMKLSASQAECKGLKEEVERLKILLEESVVKQEATENLKFHTKDVNGIQKELEDEIKFQKESNVNLSVQLKKTQESNVELISILQELEDTIEKQKMEINNLLTLKVKSEDMEKSICEHDDSSSANPAGEVFTKKMIKAASDSDLEGNIVEHPVRDSQAEFKPENRNLEPQLQKLQESIQFLEKALEEKDREIELKQGFRTQSLLDCEAKWMCKLVAKEQEIIILEKKLSEVLDAQGSKEMNFERGGDHNLNEELKALKDKMQELERDCNELTNENLELLFKLKESKKDPLTRNNSDNFSSSLCASTDCPTTFESEITELKSQIYQLEQELKKKEIFIKELAANSIQNQSLDLENKITDLELQLQAFKDKACYINGELHECRAKAEERENVFAALQQQLECFQGNKTETDHFVPLCRKFENCKSHVATELSKIFYELCKQLQQYLANINKQQCSLCFSVNTGDIQSFYNPEISEIQDLMTQKEQAEAILSSLIQLNKFFEGKDELQCSEADIKAAVADSDEFQNKLDGHLKENLCFPIEVPKNFYVELETKFADLGKELSGKISEIQELRADHSLKVEEIEALRCCQRELEIQISDLQKEKTKSEENMKILLRQSRITSDCLDNVRNDMVVLNSYMDSQVSANKVLEKKSLELESGKDELELHLSELEEENVQLSERVSGLEAQLRYLTDDKESNRLELLNSASHAMELQDEIKRLETEMEEQKFDMKQKLQDMQKRWLEAQEECEYLKRANPKLQLTAESLIEECSLLQEVNVELRKRKMESDAHCTVLDAQLRESHEKFSNISKKAEALEAKFSSMLEEIASKERILSSQLDAVLYEHKEYKEKLVLGESLLNQMYLEKAEEVENLQREVAHLTEQISATHDERERAASKAVLEVSSLWADKSKLEAAFQEVQGKLKLCEKRLATLQIESENKVLLLMGELTTSQQDHEILMASHKKLLALLEDANSNEERLKSTVCGLELKLQASEYERLQLEERIAGLNVKLHKIPVLQDEILALKTSLNAAKFENDGLEASVKLLSGETEDLKAEKTSYVQKISSMQKTISELEDCRHYKVSLEEKILRLEGDLIAREALCAQEAELKNELGRLKITHSQFQRKIKILEEEKEECLKRAQALEEKLKQIKEGKLGPSDSSAKDFYTESSCTSISVLDELKFSEVDGGHCTSGSSQVAGIDPFSKIQNEIAEALGANDLYKKQLNRLLSEGKNSDLDAPKSLPVSDDAARKKGSEHKESSLEEELRDIRERYFRMSLKYAEVEAQREDLVMKLKEVNNGRSWFP